MNENPFDVLNIICITIWSSSANTHIFKVMGEEISGLKNFLLHLHTHVHIRLWL